MVRVVGLEKHPVESLKATTVYLPSKLWKEAGTRDKSSVTLSYGVLSALSINGALIESASDPLNHAKLKA